MKESISTIEYMAFNCVKGNGMFDEVWLGSGSVQGGAKGACE